MGFFRPRSAAHSLRVAANPAPPPGTCHLPFAQYPSPAPAISTRSARMSRLLSPAALMLAAALLVQSADAPTAVGQDKAKKKRETKAPVKKDATPAEALVVLPGFKVELLFTADPAAEGSWINMCKDGKGRLIVSGQPGSRSSRFTIKDGKVAKVEKLDLPITEAMGMLYAFDSLYVNGDGPEGFGLYRCKDTKGAGQYDDVKLLKQLRRRSGEHGPHGLALGPDNKIYVINGNHTKLPDGLSPRLAAQELPRGPPAAAAVGRQRPRGRHPRPRRLRPPHRRRRQDVGAGARPASATPTTSPSTPTASCSPSTATWSGTGACPGTAPSASTTAPAGPSSAGGPAPASGRSTTPTACPPSWTSASARPTGVTNGVGAKFPAKYQKALYVLDWTYGRLLAVHLTPSGSSYTATFENFVAPKGLDGREGQEAAQPDRRGDRRRRGHVLHHRRPQHPGRRSTASRTPARKATAPADLHDDAGAKERAAAARARGLPRQAEPEGAGRRLAAPGQRRTASCATPPASPWRASRWRSGRRRRWPRSGRKRR